MSSRKRRKLGKLFYESNSLAGLLFEQEEDKEDEKWKLEGSTRRDGYMIDKYSTCFGYAEEHNLVNPLSFHPLKTGYKFIGDYFIKFLTPHMDDGL